MTAYLMFGRRRKDNAVLRPQSTLGRVAVWLRRASYCRGFGVQSPFAYSFVRYVVNEHYPYYAYDDLRRAIPHVRGTDRKLMRLYFRLANYRQAAVFYDAGGLWPEALRRYVTAGCRSTRVTSDDDSAAVLEMVRIGRTLDDRALMALLDRTDARTVLIVEHIGRRKDMARLWRRILDDRRRVVAFDLYYCGIVFFDPEKFRRNYIINF